MISLKLHQVVPTPIADRDHRRSAIWQQEVTFQGGEWHHLCAPSGTGKTSLAHLLYGLRHDYTGTYEIGTQQADTLRLDDWCVIRQTGMSMIFQDLRLLPAYSARDNIRLKAALQPVVTEAEWLQWAERLGIRHIIDQPVHTLSQGERQRTAIIRSLVQPFNWLVADEPFSHLDHQNTQLAVTLIQEVLRQRQAGLICLQLEPDNLFPYHHQWTL